MNFLYKLERKFGKFAVRNLSAYIIIVITLAYIMELGFPDVYSKVVFDPAGIVYRHEYWRIITWIFTTPGQFNMLTLVVLFCYYLIGSSIERSIGTFLFNIYIFGQMIFVSIGATIFSFIRIKSIDVDNITTAGLEDLVLNATPVAGQRMTYYFLVSLFLGYAIVHANDFLLFMFIIPIRAKWLAYIDLAVLIYDFVKYPVEVWRVTIVVCIFYFALMYALVGKYTPRNARNRRSQEFKRRMAAGMRMNYDNRANQNVGTNANKGNGMSAGITRHKCAICGRSERDGDMIEFRFCSKCNGNYEYCNDHLFTHEHVK